MEVKGTNGSIKLLDDRILLRKKSAGLIKAKREKTIPIANISSIQFSGAKRFKKLYGFIQFNMGGSTKSLRFNDVKRDPDSVVFTFRESPRFEKLKELIEEKMIEIQAGPSSVIVQAKSELDELEKLGSLLEKGIITQEEFELKKKQLLGL